MKSLQNQICRGWNVIGASRGMMSGCIFSAGVMLLLQLLVAIPPCLGEGVSPTTPRHVKAAPGDGYITVYWLPVTGAASYNVYWDTSPVRRPANKVSGLSSPWTHTELTNGTTYYYAVTAVVGGMESSPSYLTGAKPGAAAPGNLRAYGADASAVVTWNPAKNAVSYNLYWSMKRGVTPATGNKVAGVVSPYKHSPLTNGKPYYYVVTAMTSSGETSPSLETSATPGVKPSGSPGKITASGRNSEVSVSWGAVSGAVSYNLYWSNTPGFSPAQGTKIPQVASPYNHTGLSNGHRYYYVVTALTAAGEGIPSLQAGAMPVLPPPPKVEAFPAENGAILTWRQVEGANSYTVYYSTSSGVTPSSGQSIPGALSGNIIRGLANNTTYYFVVTAVGSQESAPSREVSVLTPFAPWRGTIQQGIGGSRVFAVGVSTDPDENVHVVGAAYDGLDGNAAIGTPDVFVTKYDPAGVSLWTAQLGQKDPSGNPMNVVPNAVASDSAGNCYVVGFTNADLDGNIKTGRQDCFVTKFNSAGMKQWTRTLGASDGTTFGTGVAVDAAGNIYVAGYADGSVDGNPLQDAHYSLFAAKYDSGGTVIWIRQVGAWYTGSEVRAVATDMNGNVYLAGFTSEGLDGNALSGLTDLFVTAFDSSGTRRWTTQAGVSDAETQANSIACDGLGNIYVAGFTGGDLDGNSLTGSQDGFVAKFNASGARLWTRLWGAESATTRARGVAAYGIGNVYVAGFTYGALADNVLHGDSDAFLTIYDAAGEHVHTAQLGVNKTGTYASTVAVGPAGDAFVGGTTLGGLGGNPLVGLTDYFLSKYDYLGRKY